MSKNTIKSFTPKFTVTRIQNGNRPIRVKLLTPSSVFTNTSTLAALKTFIYYYENPQPSPLHIVLNNVKPWRNRTSNGTTPITRGEMCGFSCFGRISDKSNNKNSMLFLMQQNQHRYHILSITYDINCFYLF